MDDTDVGPPRPTIQHHGERPDLRSHGQRKKLAILKQDGAHVGCARYRKGAAIFMRVAGMIDLSGRVCFMVSKRIVGCVNPKLKKDVRMGDVRAGLIGHGRTNQARG